MVDSPYLRDASPPPRIRRNPVSNLTVPLLPNKSQILSLPCNRRRKLDPELRERGKNLSTLQLVIRHLQSLHIPGSGIREHCIPEFPSGVLVAAAGSLPLDMMCVSCKG